MRKSRQRKDDHLTNEVKHKVSKSKRKLNQAIKRSLNEVEKMKRQEESSIVKAK